MKENLAKFDGSAHDIYSTVFLLASSAAEQFGVRPISNGSNDLAPVRYQAPPVDRKTAPGEALQRLILASLLQLCANLLLLHESDDPEIVHQARIGWRRLRCLIRLFKPMKHLPPAPAAELLNPVIDLLGELRDLDVARLEVLPHLQLSDAEGEAAHAKELKHLIATLSGNAQLVRKSLLTELGRPAIRAGLWSFALWSEELRVMKRQRKDVLLRHWVRPRIRQLRHELEKFEKKAANEKSQHRTRILAKRLRYATEDFDHLFPPGKVRKWHEHAVDLQTRLGKLRDNSRAAELAYQLDAPNIASLLRKTVAGTEIRRTPHITVDQI